MAKTARKVSRGKKKVIVLVVDVPRRVTTEILEKAGNVDLTVALPNGDTLWLPARGVRVADTDL